MLIRRADQIRSEQSHLQRRAVEGRTTIGEATEERQHRNHECLKLLPVNRMWDAIWAMDLFRMGFEGVFKDFEGVLKALWLSYSYFLIFVPQIWKIVQRNGK